MWDPVDLSIAIVPASGYRLKNDSVIRLAWKEIRQTDTCLDNVYTLYVTKPFTARADACMVLSVQEAADGLWTLQALLIGLPDRV